MQYAELLRTELDASLQNAAPAWCISAMRRIVDLFLCNAAEYSEDHIALYDVVLNKLVAKIGEAELSELSERLALVDNAPPDTIRYLSRHANIRVAGPILEKSAAIAVRDLVEIAATATHAHLLAISSRSRIDKEITDVLFCHGSPSVICRIVENEGASISEISFVKLINAANKDKTLANMIASRRDLPEELRSFLSLALN
jgi:uncharacterized protein (DUF2336 family)